MSGKSVRPTGETPKASQDQPIETDTAADVEGHNMWVHPTVSGNLAESRSRDLERQAREHQRQQETRNKEQKQK